MQNQKVKPQDEFEQKFKDMIKSIIKEETYIKQEDIKDLAKIILDELDSIIAKRVKEHFVFLANNIIKQYGLEEKQI